MEAHPGIVFRDGPAGRRPGLVGGPDVWEVVRVFLGVRAQGSDPIEHAADLTGLALPLVRTAVWYYADHPEEVDTWIARVDAEAAEAVQAWRREQALLGR